MIFYGKTKKKKPKMRQSKVSMGTLMVIRDIASFYLDVLPSYSFTSWSNSGSSSSSHHIHIPSNRKKVKVPSLMMSYSI